jgi:DNA-binding transcriptional LysR family regulator
MTTDLRRLAALDLNLLVSFQALAEERHVTRAARRLGGSQPALSQALKRLRETLDDELFVKTPKGMVPTERARALIPHVAEILAQVEGSLLPAGAWNLATSKRSFRIQSTDLIDCLILPELLPVLQAEAPQTSLSLTTARFALPREELEDGRCDLAIAGFFGELPPGFYRQKLLSDGFVVAISAKHPRLRSKTKLSLDEFCQERHLIVAPGGELSGGVDRLLAKQGRSRTLVAGLSTFAGAAMVLARSECLLVGPSVMFRDHAGLKTFPLPVEIPTIQIVQVWHERCHRDPHHRWLREQLRRLLGG